MSFLGQTNSSTGSILSDLSALLANVSSSIDGSNNSELGGQENDPTQAFQNNPAQAGDDFGSSQPNPLNALGLILEGVGELMQLLGDGQSGGIQPQNNDPYFNTFSASDNGDPHLSFTGDEQGGPTAGNPGGIQPQTQTANAQPQDTTVSKNWNDMNGETDMLHADLNGGTYQLSTDVTTPVANGATLNKSAQITFGDDSVSVNNQGQVELSMDGDQWSLGAGQSYTFGNGLTVSNSANGQSTTVSMNGPNGQNISTTISQAGNFEGQNYLNISASGNDVNLGGYMVDQAAGTNTENDAQPSSDTGYADSSMQFLEEEMAMQQENEQNFGGIEQQLSAMGQQPPAFGGGNDQNNFNAVSALATDDDGGDNTQQAQGD